VRYDNFRAFQKHVKDAFPLYVSPVHLIIGKNAIENQEAVHFLLDLFLPNKEVRKLSLIQLEASQLEEMQLSTALHSFTLFSKTRVIWIQNIDKLKKNVQELLEKFCSHFVSQQNIILSSSSPIVKNSTFYKTIEKQGSILEFIEMKPWEKEKQLMDWLPKQAALSSIKISYAACQKLIKQIGLDAAILSQELEKIICYCGKREEITIEDVEKIGSYQSHETIWRLGEAIFDRDVKTALEVSRAFLLDNLPYHLYDSCVHNFKQSYRFVFC
jgi:DNA polymerase-3 subunit delta